MSSIDFAILPSRSRHSPSSSFPVYFPRAQFETPRYANQGDTAPPTFDLHALLLCKTRQMATQYARGMLTSCCYTQPGTCSPMHCPYDTSSVCEHITENFSDPRGNAIETLNSSVACLEDSSSSFSWLYGRYILPRRRRLQTEPRA